MPGPNLLRRLILLLALLPAAANAQNFDSLENKDKGETSDIDFESEVKAEEANIQQSLPKDVGQKPWNWTLLAHALGLENEPQNRWEVRSLTEAGEVAMIYLEAFAKLRTKERSFKSAEATLDTIENLELDDDSQETKHQENRLDKIVSDYTRQLARGTAAQRLLIQLGAASLTDGGRKLQLKVKKAQDYKITRVRTERRDS